jgi:hypothetical protein
MATCYSVEIKGTSYRVLYRFQHMLLQIVKKYKNQHNFAKNNTETGGNPTLQTGHSTWENIIMKKNT